MDIYIYNHCLVVWNMIFIFHNKKGPSFPLTNSYFSRWLKPPTSNGWYPRIVGLLSPETIISLQVGRWRRSWFDPVWVFHGNLRRIFTSYPLEQCSKPCWLMILGDFTTQQYWGLSQSLTYQPTSIWYDDRGFWTHIKNSKTIWKTVHIFWIFLYPCSLLGLPCWTFLLLHLPFSLGAFKQWKKIRSSCIILTISRPWFVETFVGRRGRAKTGG